MLSTIIEEAYTQDIDIQYKYKCPICNRPGERLAVCNKGDVILFFCHTAGCKLNKGLSKRINGLSTTQIKSVLNKECIDRNRIYKLPTDITRYIPSKFLHYLKGYDISSEGMYYSEYLDRLIITTEDGYLARSLDELPKWKNYTNKYYSSGINGDYNELILCEDPISCIKLGNVKPCISLLGTKIAPQWVLDVVKYSMIYIWMDNDRAGLFGTLKLKSVLSPYTETKIIKSNKDPKCYSLFEISEYLK